MTHDINSPVSSIEDMAQDVSAQYNLHATEGVTARKVLPKLVTVEGIDGCGKTTLIAGLVAFLEEHGIKVRQMSMLPEGPIREALLSDATLTPMQQVLLLLTAAESVRRDIEEALREGDFVLCDRGPDSLHAYQGYGENLASFINNFDFYPEFRSPDLTIYLDLPVDVSRERLQARQQDSDVFEAKNDAFYERVRAGYQYRIDNDPDRFLIIDATSTLGMVLFTAKTRLEWMLEG